MSATPFNPMGPHGFVIQYGAAPTGRTWLVICFNKPGQGDLLQAPAQRLRGPESVAPGWIERPDRS
jgi:hypothetical protein